MNCEMVNVHHSDCECALCKAHKDEFCDKKAVGITTDGKVRVCVECAKGMESEGFDITYTCATCGDVASDCVCEDAPDYDTTEYWTRVGQALMLIRLTP